MKYPNPEQHSPAWYQTTAELAAIYGEMCAINETPAKDQTPAQQERLKVLRSECVAIQYRRIAMVAPVPANIVPVEYEVLDLPYPDLDVRIKQARQRDGSAKWKIERHGMVFGKDGEWDFEPMPSSRTDAWLAQYRFDSLGEAIQAIPRAVAAKLADMGLKG